MFCKRYCIQNYVFWMYRHPLVPITLHLCQKGSIECKNIIQQFLLPCTKYTFNLCVTRNSTQRHTACVHLRSCFFLIYAYFILKYLSLFKRLFVLLYLNIYICHCGLAGRDTGIMYILPFVKILKQYEKPAFTASAHQTSLKSTESFIFLKTKQKEHKILKTVLKKTWFCLEVIIAQQQLKKRENKYTFLHVYTQLHLCLYIY